MRVRTYNQIFYHSPSFCVELLLFLSTILFVFVPLKAYVVAGYKWECYC